MHQLAIASNRTYVSGLHTSLFTKARVITWQSDTSDGLEGPCE